MQHLLSLDNLRLEDVWLTIGSFDGVHLGHQEIIHKLTTEAHDQEALAVVLTFFPHPATVLRARDFPFYLTNPDEKVELMANFGVDIVITHSFDRDLAATPAREFMKTLHHHLGLHHLIIGYDFALGQNRMGNAEALSGIGSELNFSVEQIKPYKINEQIVSSSHIRFLLGAGQVEKAARLLDRNYTVVGTVILGDQRGRTIGFPTANLDIWSMRAIPAAGVYVCRASVNGNIFGAVTNIGVRPTFEASPVPPRVEAHLLDFQGDLYGKSIELEFITRLRGEKRFASADELIAQIQKDVKAAVDWLS
ncbi:bifunctional riboflavin kinase/FAD synthetase [Chloroflexota bacterium]